MGAGTEDPQAMSAMMERKVPFLFLGMAIGLLLSIPFMMSFWFPTPLIAVGGTSCAAAVKLSFKGALRNILPFIVYLLSLLIFGLGCFVVIWSLSAALAFSMMNSESFIMLGLVPMLIFVLVALPFSLGVGLSVYSGFRDIFYKAS